MDMMGLKKENKLFNQVLFPTEIIFYRNVQKKA
jgi:hypothetical protein